MNLILEAQKDILGQIGADKLKIYNEFYTRLNYGTVELKDEGLSTGDKVWRMSYHPPHEPAPLNIIETAYLSVAISYILMEALDEKYNMGEYGKKLINKYIPKDSYHTKKKELRFLIEIIARATSRFYNNIASKNDEPTRISSNEWFDVIVDRLRLDYLYLNSLDLKESVNIIESQERERSLVENKEEAEKILTQQTAKFREWLRDYTPVIINNKDHVYKFIKKVNEFIKYIPLERSILNITKDVLDREWIRDIITNAFDEDIKIIKAKFLELTGYQLKPSSRGSTGIERIVGRNWSFTYSVLEYKYQTPFIFLVNKIIFLLKLKFPSYREFHKQIDERKLQGIIEEYYEQIFGYWVEDWNYSDASFFSDRGPY